MPPFPRGNTSYYSVADASDAGREKDSAAQRPAKPNMAGAAAFSTALANRRGSTQASKASAAFCPLLPCTTTPASPCQIVDHLSPLNELLVYAKLELRELPAPCGQLSLVSLAEENLFLQDHSCKSFNRVVALGCHLLKMHSCIQHIRIGHTLSSFIFYEAFKWDTLTGLLKVDFREFVINEDADDDYFFHATSGDVKTSSTRVM